MRLGLDDVPVALQRRAAQHLEDVRRSEMAAGASRARLSGRVCPVHRPDVDGVAYYEFEVELRRDRAIRLVTGDAAKRLQVSQRRGDPETPEDATAFEVAEAPGDDPEVSGLRLRPTRPPTHGFLLLSTGQHDFPMPHWSLERAPISHELEAAAKRAGGKVARIVKVDALAYVAEDEHGRMIAHVGQLPPIVAGLPPLDRASEHLGQLRAAPREPVPDDRGADRVSFEVTARDADPPDLRYVDPRGWERLRDGYAGHFGVFLEQLEQLAAESWEVERLVEEFGEGIYTGTVHHVALLQTDAAVEVSGEGARFVRVTLADRPDGPPALRIDVPAVRGQERPHTTELRTGEAAPRGDLATTTLDHEASLDLQIVYGDGTEELLRFFVVPPSAPSNERGIDDGNEDDEGDRP
jgi:hypothetical protein